MLVVYLYRIIEVCPNLLLHSSAKHESHRLKRNIALYLQYGGAEKCEFFSSQKVCLFKHVYPIISFGGLIVF